MAALTLQQIIGILKEDPNSVLAAIQNALNLAPVSAAHVISATGQTLTVAAGTSFQTFSPAANYAAMTVALPAMPADGFRLAIKNITSFAITTTTWPASVPEAPAFGALGSVDLAFSSTTGNWSVV